MNWLTNLIDKINTRTGILMVIVAIVLILTVFNLAFAHHYDHDINIDIDIDNGGGGNPSTNSSCMTCITSGFDDEAFAQALTQAYASGAHELDWSTDDLQLSFTYALQFDGEEEDAYSIKFGKKKLFGDKFLANGMFHLTLNPEVEDLGNTAVFGATFRIP